MKELEQTKHLLDQILERQKASDDVNRLLLSFHEDLFTQLNSTSRFPISRTNIIGITYLCNAKKAFLFLNIGQQFLTAKFFTGNKSIKGIGKGIWINKNDNLGSEPYRIYDKATLKHALDFSCDAFDIADDWTR